MSRREGTQTEEKYQSEMGKTSYPVLPGETKGSIHDIHSVFTTLMRYIRALNLLAPNSWAPDKVESETISLLKMSKAAIGDQGNTQLALVSILSNIESKDLDSIKSRLYSLYTNVKLRECALILPEGFFSQ